MGGRGAWRQRLWAVRRQERRAGEDVTFPPWHWGRRQGPGPLVPESPTTPDGWHLTECPCCSAPGSQSQPAGHGVQMSLGLRLCPSLRRVLLPGTFLLGRTSDRRRVGQRAGQACPQRLCAQVALPAAAWPSCPDPWPLPSPSPGKPERGRDSWS